MALFEDEAGSLDGAGKARTWDPAATPPWPRVSGNAGRLSVAAWPASSPGGRAGSSTGSEVHRRRKGDRASMSEADYAALVSAAHRTQNAPVVLVWDNLNTHRSQKMRAYTEANSDWLTVIHLPAYAPDLNAVEGAWASMKSSLGNHAATTLTELEATVRSHCARRSSGAPTSSTPSSAKPASTSNPRRPNGQTLAFQPL